MNDLDALEKLQLFVDGLQKNVAYHETIGHAALKEIYEDMYHRANSRLTVLKAHIDQLLVDAA